MTTSRPARTLLAGLLLVGACAAQAVLPDTDGDGVPDLLDNCITVANADQADADNDGIGNVCDADVNNDNAVDATDMALLLANLGKRAALGDLNGDGVVDQVDVDQLTGALGMPPGLSAMGRNPPTRNGRNPTTSDGRSPPTAESVQVLRLSATLPGGRNALVLADFGAFFRADTANPPPAKVVLFNNGDAQALRRAGYSATDLGHTHGLGAQAGELVLLNDLGVMGDELAGDGIYSGLARIDAALIDAEAQRFLARARSKQAKEVIAFNGRVAAETRPFDPAAPFEPAGAPRSFSFTLPGFGRVSTTGVPMALLKPLLPPTTAADRTLLINAPGVVQDPGRSYMPCNNAGAPTPIGTVDGPWSFKTLMSAMANTPLTGVPAQTFVNDWLRLWLAPAVNVKHDDGMPVPSFPIPPRPQLQTVINTLQPGWNPAVPATLNMNRLPFRLLAIVNRLDLAESGYAGHASAGELRFVFGVLKRNGVGQCVPADEMTVILEYKLPDTNCTGLKMLADQWIALDALVPGTPAYNAQLQALTDMVTKPGAAPARLNGSAIGQVRTNERLLPEPVWEMREFTLQKNLVWGSLLHTTVKNTPDPSHNKTPRLREWIGNHPGETVPRQFLGQDFIGTANRYGPGAFPANPPWNGDIDNITQKRFRFSSNTCGGCHKDETDTNFTMIGAKAPLGAPAPLAGFLTGIDADDAEYGIPPLPGAMRHFNDLKRRGQNLDLVAAQSCLALPRTPLFQAPALLQLPERPESIFGPRFVH
jgi:Thrombospondin type 3 repeat